MLTIPRGPQKSDLGWEYKVSKRMLQVMIDQNDCKKWIIAEEVGKNGYEHWQIRVETSNKAFFDWVHQLIPCAHVEESNHEWKETYERKEAKFWSWCDTNQVRNCRFGQPRNWQKRCIKAFRTQNDRQIDVWYDPVGQKGKSWLAGHLHETGQAFMLPRLWGDSDDLASMIVRHYNHSGVIVIDIPREKPIPKNFYAAVEMMKDGLIGTCKYEGGMIHIRGVKIVIFTNEQLDKNKLSHDRWRLHGIKKEESAAPSS